VAKALFKSFSRFYGEISVDAFNKIQQMISELDSNKDGDISREEWIKGGMKINLVKLLLVVKCFQKFSKIFQGPDYDN
jgi:hypothetical protein